MDLTFEALDSALAADLRRGGPDANGQPAERGAISDGEGVPCRHCLSHVPAGREYLILAHRPFPAPQPYAETGPIFLCADDCGRWHGAGVPPILATSPDYLLKGYSADHRIVCGSLAFNIDVKAVLEGFELREGANSDPREYVVEKAFVGDGI